MTSTRPRLYLHIGTPKTGTTYLQDVCWHNRELLAEDGVRYPGTAADSQFRAVIDVMSGRFPDWHDRVVPGSWAAIVAESREAVESGRSVFLSHELLAPASPDEARRVLDDLSFAEIHIVCTARNLASQIPSVWQEDVKNGHRFGFREFAAALAEDRPRSVWLADVFWDFQDLPTVLRTWGGHLPPEQVHVLPVPARGAGDDVLWRRFADLLGLRPTGYRTDVRRGNRSLGMAEAELVRRINVALADRVTRRDYQDVVKFRLAQRHLAERAGKAPIVLEAGQYTWARQRAQEFVEAIEKAGYHVVGDLADLLPGDPPEGAAKAQRPPEPEELLDVSLDALGTLVDQLVAELEKPAPPQAPAGWKHRLVALSERHEAMMRVRKGYSRLASRRR
ncbi:hypothetical protein B0I33_109100 [Prauserella shujinwangii]|uniref:Sulfotransferase family protein n=1 Tax=Prauserella shujinwangii TaxID=1453103 RepID=A0A2T0LQ08_9PSEU|nr:hypothetical protein [Prauserella shujinwangii]PRX45437.1 hypothetical protein B0I33_109100 [Prauserella shujinwangii]